MTLRIRKTDSNQFATVETGKAHLCREVTRINTPPQCDCFSYEDCQDDSEYQCQWYSHGQEYRPPHVN
jgi:hypothetical protein